MNRLLSPADIRIQAPILSAAADRIAQYVFMPAEVTRFDGLRMKVLGVTEWLIVLELLSQLLAIYQANCAANAKPVDAAAWLRDARWWMFRRFRLRLAIAREWGGRVTDRPALVDAISRECDNATELELVPAFQEAKLLVS